MTSPLAGTLGKQKPVGFQRRRSSEDNHIVMVSNFAGCGPSQTIGLFQVPFVRCYQAHMEDFAVNVFVVCSSVHLSLNFRYSYGVAICNVGFRRLRVHSVDKIPTVELLGNSLLDARVGGEIWPS